MKNWFVTTMLIGALACPVAQAANKTETSTTTDRVSASTTRIETHQKGDRAVRHHRHGHRAYHHRHHGHHHRHSHRHHHSGCYKRSHCESSCGYTANTCCVSSPCGDRHHRGHHHYRGAKHAHHRHHGHDRKAYRSSNAGYAYGYASSGNSRTEMDNPEKTHR